MPALLALAAPMPAEALPTARWTGDGGVSAF
jgi:hypothetical protein